MSETRQNVKKLAIKSQILHFPQLKEDKYFITQIKFKDEARSRNRSHKPKGFATGNLLRLWNLDSLFH
jgi:hypothetical protein